MQQVEVPIDLDLRFARLGLTDLYELESDLVLDELETNPFPEELGGVLDRIGQLAKQDREDYLHEFEHHARSRAAELQVEVAIVQGDHACSPEARPIYAYAIARATLPGGLGVRGEDLSTEDEPHYGTRLRNANRGYRNRAA